MDVSEELNESHPQGSVDALNTVRGLGLSFETDNGAGIPLIPKETRVPDVLIPHKTRLNHQLSLEDEPFSAAVHFFLEDYRFESVWSTPLAALFRLPSSRKNLPFYRVGHRDACGECQRPRRARLDLAASV